MTTTISGDTGVSAVQSGVVAQGDLANNVVGNGPAFHATGDGSQTLTADIITQVLFPNETFDTASSFAASKFQPSVAGYYQINFGIVTATNGITRLLVMLYKNNAEIARSGDISGPIYAYGVAGSELVYLNGSTDYLEIFAYSEAVGAVLTAITTRFSGFLARAA